MHFLLKGLFADFDQEIWWLQLLSFRQFVTVIINIYNKQIACTLSAWIES